MTFATLGLGLAMASQVFAAPDCVTSSSRVPMASQMPTAGAAPAYRLAMARAAPSRPSATARPSGHRVRNASVHRAKAAGPSRVRKAAAVHRRARPAAQARRPAAVARAPAAVPTSPQVAARRVAYARYALIDTTVCETGAPPLQLLSLAGPPNAAEAGVPAVGISPAGPDRGDGGGTSFLSPGQGMDDGAPTFVDGGPSLPGTPGGGGEPPFIDVGGPNPPMLPPVDDGEPLPPGGDDPNPPTPPVDDDGQPPFVDVDGPPTTTPPVLPPGGPSPPIEPSGPPTTAVPEPGTWALMIGGFGFVGAALRRRARLQA